MGVQLWHRPAGHGHVHRAPDRDQAILRYRYQEMSPRHESRRSHIAGYGLQDQRPAADDGRRGRPIRNLWLTNNWKIDANPEMNPGANAVRRLAQGNRLGAQITQHPSSVMSGPRLRFLLWH